MPSVSVLLPVYNGSDAVARALRSVEGQTFRDFETIVIDDGSTDKTASIVQSFPWVKLIRQPNAGIGFTRQRLVHEAAGDWIAFLDHDDEWTPTKLERQVAVANASSPVLVHGWSDQAFPDGRTVARRWSPPASATVLDHLLPNNEVVTSTTLIRREAMLEAGFPESMSKAEDWLGWFRVAALGDFGHVPEVLATKHERTLSASTPDLGWFEAERSVLEDHVLPNLDVWYDRLPQDLRARFRQTIRRKLGLIASLEAACLDALGRRSEASPKHRQALRDAPTKGALMRYARHVMRR